MEATTSILPEDGAAGIGLVAGGIAGTAGGYREQGRRGGRDKREARLALDMMDMGIWIFLSLIRLFWPGRMLLLLHHRPTPNTTEYHVLRIIIILHLRRRVAARTPALPAEIPRPDDDNAGSPPFFGRRERQYPRVRTIPARGFCHLRPQSGTESRAPSFGTRGFSPFAAHVTTASRHRPTPAPGRRAPRCGASSQTSASRKAIARMMSRQAHSPRLYPNGLPGQPAPMTGTSKHARGLTDQAGGPLHRSNARHRRRSPRPCRTGTNGRRQRIALRNSSRPTALATAPTNIDSPHSLRRKESARYCATGVASRPTGSEDQKRAGPPLATIRASVQGHVLTVQLMQHPSGPNESDSPNTTQRWGFATLRTISRPDSTASFGRTS